MILKEIDNVQVAEFFKQDPALAVLSMSDEALVELHEKGTYSNDNCKWQGLYLEDELFSIIRYELFTSTTLNTHLYVSTKLQRKGLALEVQKFLKDWCNKEYPFIKRIQTFVPDPCKHVRKSAEKYNMKYEGTLKKCILWRGKLVDLHIYGKHIGEE